ncbi:MAG: hypothetical protein P4L53_17840 [Candidatus Obscuribacterales bacterium]|nr:hypothetical protein [Candidatus Obscuribacterales bacterium]
MIFGLYINASLLRDADTWWLLGLGRWICEHRSLPLTDPFSYTMAYQAGRQYLPHQWLSAVTFYLTYHLGAIQLLLMLCVGVLFSAFVVLPLRALKSAAPFWFAFALTAVGVFAAKFHFLARPEIFSYLLQALMLTCLYVHRLKVLKLNPEQSQELKPSQIFASLDFGFISAVAVIFVLWCNLHSGFIFGAIFLVAYSFSSLLIGVWRKSLRSVDWTVIAVTCLLPLLAVVNPFGLKLLIYLKEQLWFDPFENTVGEMMPISLTNPTFFPFFVLVLTFIGLLLLTLRRSLSSNQSALFLLTSVLVSASPIFVAFQHRRLILFAVLVILFECAVIMHAWRRAIAQTDSEPELNANANRVSFLWRLSTWTVPVVVSMISVPVAFAWFGCDNRWDLHALSVVDRGVDFVKANAHDRRIFNDFLLGDRMIWLTPGHPLVFMDTRYDMYGGKLVEEYDVVSMGQPGWQNVLDKYKVEMVCFFVKSRIADLLREEPEWRMVYSDSRTVVFER